MLRQILAGAQEYHRDPRRRLVGSQGSHELVPGYVGHVDIDDRQIRLGLPDQMEGSIAAVGGFGGSPNSRESAASSNG